MAGTFEFDSESVFTLELAVPTKRDFTILLLIPIHRDLRHKIAPTSCSAVVFQSSLRPQLQNSGIKQ